MLLNSKNNITRVMRPLNSILQRNYASMEKQRQNVKDVKVPFEFATGMDVPLEEPINAHILTTQIGSYYRKWVTVLEKHPELKTLKRNDVINSAKMLKKLNFDAETILTKPVVLHQNALTIQNRFEVLNECGFEPITLMLLSKYVTVINKTVTLMKSYGHIKFETNVLEKLCNCFTDVELCAKDFQEFNDGMLIKEVREGILNAYLRQRLNMNDDEIKKLWLVYNRVRHRSFKSVQAVIKILLEELKFPRERIIKNPYLLYADANNISRIINEIRSIDGQNIRDIVYRRPKILMSGCDGLLKSLEYLKAYGISELAVTKCFDILTLGSDTILERLKDMHAIEEFKVLGTNPRVLRLVHYQNKARMRLEYLNQLKVRCASLHILSGASENFAKFARDGTDRTKGRDVVICLANILKKDENNIRTLLARHPNWCHIPVLQVKQCLDFLLSKKFTLTAIYDSLHLLLYPIQRIEEKMTKLYDPEFLEELQLPVNSIDDVTKNEILTLILYLIECEYHFTGDGIWTEQQTQHVENFNNIFLDFPENINKVYKYGMKTSASGSFTTNGPAVITARN